VAPIALEQMKQLTTLLLTLLLTTNCFAQLVFSFGQIDIDKAKFIEDSLKSKEFKVDHFISVSADYFPGATNYDLDQPLLYTRKEENFINDLEVQYFFTPSDNKVRLVVYSWDSKGNTKKLKYNDKLSSKDLEKNRIEVYNQKYEQLLESLKNKLGDPTEGSGDLEVVKQAGYGESKQRKAKWDNGNMKVELNMIWTDQNLKTGNGVKLVPTFRIRSKIYWD
jgi:hypothetical protein